MQRGSFQRSEEPGRGRRFFLVTLVALISACVSAPAPAPTPVANVTRAAPIVFDFPAAGDDVVVSSETMRGRATALVFITTFDLASQLLARRLGEAVVAFTPRANAAAVVIEAPQYAELLPAYREALALPFPVVMADFATQHGTGPFGPVTVVPTLIVLDRDGREVWRHEGAVEGNEIEAALRRASAR
jgi:hypothetical protein